MAVNVFELELELTDGTHELVMYTHKCRDLPASFKSNHRMFRKKEMATVTQVMGIHNHMKFRVWTTDEATIPELKEQLRIAAVRRVTEIQTKASRLYDQITNIHRDTPATPRGLGWRA